MTKNELCVAATNKCGTKVSVEMVDAVIDSMKDALISGDTISLRGFATIFTQVTPERVGNNISKGIKVVIPAHKVVKFKTSKEFLSKLQ